MVFGDNVRARTAARALPRTPTQEEEKEENKKDKRENHTPSHHRHPPNIKPSPPFHNDTTLSQKHGTKPTML